MTSIEDIGHPLVYKATVKDRDPAVLSEMGIAIRADVRVLEGMQKEALVYYGPTGTIWRMVSDEGPYLNGTDLAPFPLAYFAAGMALSFVEELLRHAEARAIKIKDYKLTQDNFYTMEGSAIRGDMIGSALPVQWLLEIQSEASKADIQSIVDLAEKTSPAQVYMNTALENTFALCSNGTPIPVGSANPSGRESMFEEPSHRMQTAAPLEEDDFSENIIVKLESAETVFGVKGGAGSSLRASQKRTLHVRAIVTPREDGMREVTVKLFQPIGSSFRFLSDRSRADGGQERSPSSLAYLAAGVGFCFMTQIGRYANIMKHDLKAYSIVQDTVFDIGMDRAGAENVDTHMFLETGESKETSQQTLWMSERTCFLHAAMRLTNQTQITLKHREV